MHPTLVCAQTFGRIGTKSVDFKLWVKQFGLKFLGPQVLVLPILHEHLLFSSVDEVFLIFTFFCVPSHLPLLTTCLLFFSLFQNLFITSWLLRIASGASSQLLLIFILTLRAAHLLRSCCVSGTISVFVSSSPFPHSVLIKAQAATWTNLVVHINPHLRPSLSSQEPQQGSSGMCININPSHETVQRSPATV